jgi:hypothetical protein
VAGAVAVVVYEGESNDGLGDRHQDRSSSLRA